MSGLRRIVPPLAVAVLLVAAAVTASLSATQIRSVPSPHDSPIEGPPVTKIPSRVQHSYGPPGWFTTLISALCIAVVVVVVGLVLRERLTARRRRIEVEEPAEPPVVESREEVLAAVDAGLSNLDDTDPRRAVIACWLRLEEAAAAAGTPRQPGDAPADLVLRLLSAHQVSAGVLIPLAEVYRLARYATHTVDSGMRDSARAALRQLRAELAREPVMGSPK